MSEKKMLITIFSLAAVLVLFFALFLVLSMRLGLFDLASNQPAVFRYMREEFFTYAEPDFFAERLAANRPQMVQVTHDLGNGWLRVTSGSGRISGWVHLPQSTVVLERPMGAFACKDDAAYTKLVGPGTIQVLTQQDNWLLTHNPDGPPLWVNLYFMPSFDELASFFAAFPRPVSVFYKNIDTGFTFGHRDDVVYASASLNKAPHALYVYFLAENNMTDLSRTHVLTDDMLRGGTGVIQYMPLGTVFTEKELLTHSVRDSDNTAFHHLVSLYYDHPMTYYDFYRNNIAGNMSLVRNITGHHMTASEAGLIMHHIFNYLESGGRYTQHFKYSLLNSDVPIIVSDYPVAQKYGRWSGYFHDAAIVYACSPYILVIMSTLDRDNTGAFEEFAEISMFIQNFNNKYFRTQ